MGSTPLTARCPRCKKYREWNMDRSNYDNLSNLNLVPTGRTRKGISAGGAAQRHLRGVQARRARTHHRAVQGRLLWARLLDDTPQPCAARGQDREQPSPPRRLLMDTDNLSDNEKWLLGLFFAGVICITLWLGVSVYRECRETHSVLYCLWTQ